MSFQSNRNFLMRYREIKAKIDRLEDKLYLLDSRLEKLSSPVLTGMPRGSSNHDITDDLLMQKSETSDRINRQVQKGIKLRTEICDTIDTLVDQQEARVLELYFIDRLSIQEIADYLVFDIRWVKQLYSRGIQHLDSTQRPPGEH